MQLAALSSLAIFYTCFAFSKAEPFRHNVSFARSMDRSMQPATYYGENPLGLVRIHAALTTWGPYILYCHGVLVHKNYVMVPSSCVACRLGWEYLYWRISYTVDGYTYNKDVETIYTHPEYEGCWPHQDSVSLLYIGELSEYYEPKSVCKVCSSESEHYSLTSVVDGKPVSTEAEMVSHEKCSSLWDWLFGASTGSCVCMIGSCLEKIKGMVVVSEPVEGEYCCLGLLVDYFVDCLLGQGDVYYELARYTSWMGSIIPY